MSHLVNRLSKGDAFAFDELFNRYNTKVYSFSLRNLRNKEDARCVVQEVFLNLWKDHRKLKEIDNLDAWVFSISFNIIKKHLRRTAVENNFKKQLEASDELQDNSSVTEVEYRDMLSLAAKIIERLTPRKKEIFLLSRNEGLSNSEIAGKLNISEKSVRNHLSGAKAFLKKALIKEGLLRSLIFWWLL